MIGWANPQAKEVKTIASRAAYIKANHDTYARKYQLHYSYLTGELGYIEAVGKAAVNRFNPRNAQNA